MFCPGGGQTTAFVGELPKIVALGGGLLAITFKSGDKSRPMVMPFWLVRLVHERVGAILAEHDAEQRTAH